MKRDSRKRDIPQQPPPLTEAELQEQEIIELPDREAISIVNTNVTLPVGASAGAGLLNGSQ